MFNNSNLAPMLLKEVDQPFNSKKYLYEIKFDGIRALIHVSKNSLKIISRNGKDMTKMYPELMEIKNIVGNKKVIFDGEIIAFYNNKPSFQMLQMRGKNIFKIPVYFICFDILYEDKELIDLTLMERKNILNKYNDNSVFIKTKCYRDGIKLFQKIKKLNWEGIVAKEKDSLYIPNKRVDSWLKIKNIKDKEFIIQGYVFKKQKYSLFLGEYRREKLYYVGSVSVSPNNIIMDKVLKMKKAKNLFENFKDKGTYIEPKLEVTVTFLEWTKDRKLRHPALK